ncbi:hypothetical protein D7V97_14885 [Corallococcus sp. CA053C]|uniref:hypothetical protein n=1 Tax=Corallococcus sp. CA053C TaxID=2316732 RepID=UPI000EA089EE|nr:hypothetical protein [Corallococcus sp. CA053C]RKH10013.1 hypothetical protein D7V97_14885 [Corallococcus sp. CA053C]
MKGLLPALLILAAAPAVAAEYVDDGPYAHRRSLILSAGPGATYTERISGDDAASGLAAQLDLGVGLTVGYDRDEVFLLVRGSTGAPGEELALIGGYRSVFGSESWQTFFELGASVRPISGPWLGPRIGFGARHTLSDHFALYGGLGFTFGFGSGLRADTEFFTGLQWIIPVGSAS